MCLREISRNIFGAQSFSSWTGYKFGKSKGIKKSSRPHDLETLRGWLRTRNYLTPNWSQLAEPMSNLDMKEVPFFWGERQEMRFSEQKKRLTLLLILAHFGQEKQVELPTDALPAGVGVILIQRSEEMEQVIAYASKLLNEAQDT